MRRSGGVDRAWLAALTVVLSVAFVVEPVVWRAGTAAGSGAQAGAAAETGTSAAPVGVVDRIVVLGPGRVLLSGWAADPRDGDAHPLIDVYVGGPVGQGSPQPFGRVDRFRPDVSAAHPGADDRGYQVVLTDLAPGAQQLCVYAIVRGPDAVQLLGCPTVGVPGRGTHDPIGQLEGVSVLPDQAVRAVGWAYDPDDPSAASTVRVEALQTHPAGSELLGGSRDPCVGSAKYCNGAWLQLFALDNDVDHAKETVAADPRRDVGDAHPEAGTRHGFDHTVTRPEYHPSPLAFDVARLQAQVPTRVCAWAQNVGPGSDTLLGCLWVDVPAPSTPVITAQVYVPRASTEPLGAGEVAVEGYASAAGSPSSALRIQAYVDGPAGRGRGYDLGSIGGASASPDAFEFRLTGQAAGRHQVCAYVLDQARTRAVLVSCWYANVT
jgi:hypothetical protein